MVTHTTKRKKTSGVTLLEMMIVLAIMALVIGLAAPRFIDSFGRAKSQTASIQMAGIKGALQLFYIDVGRYPSNSEGLEALVRQPQSLKNWKGPYLDSAEGIIDPWGRRYQFKVPGANGQFDVFSLGRDGQPGGTSEDSDLYL